MASKALYAADVECQVDAALARSRADLAIFAEMFPNARFTLVPRIGQRLVTPIRAGRGFDYRPRRWPRKMKKAWKRAGRVLPAWAP